MGEGHAEARDLVGEVGVVRHDLHDLHRQLAAAVAPEQVEQAVVEARHEDRHPRALALAGEPPFHPERRRHLALEVVLERRILGEVELEPHEEPAAGALRRVLRRLHDVGAAVVEERRHGGDDPRAVGAGDEQAHGVTS